jgi:prevent-host-death family protein
MVIWDSEMSSYSVAEAKTHLSRLIDEALSGTPVTITRHGKPAVELRPALSQRRGIVPLDILNSITERARNRPSLGESGTDIIRKMRDGDE